MIIYSHGLLLLVSALHLQDEHSLETTHWAAVPKTSVLTNIMDGKPSPKFDPRLKI